MKRLINDNNPTWLNILILTIVSMVIYLIVFSPIVIFTIINNPNIFSEAESNVYGTASEAYKTLDTIRTVLQFSQIGTFLEFIRKKKVQKFKFISCEANELYKYGIAICLGYIVISLIQRMV